MSKNLPITLPIKKIINEAEGIKTFVFESDLEFQAGEFVMLWIPRMDEKPFGVWRMENGELRITISAIGEFSKKMHQLKMGDKVGIRGSYGKGFTIPEKQKIVLVGGGFGVAPLLELIREAKDCETKLLIGSRSKKFLFGEKYAKDLGSEVIIATDDGSCGEKCFNTKLLEELIEEKQVIDMVFACGPELMMKRVAEICKENGIPCELSLERYMKCGFGVCGSCAMDDSGWCVCSDGPVIEGEKALKMVEFGKYHRDSVGVRKSF